MSLKSLLIVVPCALFSICLFAQKKKKGELPNRVVCNYGDVKPEDFAPAVYPIDSSADAVYLFDGGHTKFEGNNKGFFSVVYKVHERLRLMKKNAFDNLGNVKITLHVPSVGDQQKLEDLEAATYNIENGKIVATKLDKGSIFKDKQGDFITTKFTFPNLKEGSIVEYTYTISTPGLRLPSWTFQGTYPILWSEYEIEVPQFYEYVLLKQGYQPYAIDTVRISHDTYNISDPGENAMSSIQTFTASTNTMNNIWAMKDVPALKKENFTTTMDNHVARIEFQLSAIRYPDVPPKMILRNWTDVSTELLKDEDFGAALDKSNNFFNDDVKAAIAGATSGAEKAQKIYEYVRDNFTCTDEDAFYTSQPLKKTYQGKKGNVADINLLLTAMLLSQNIEAHPVLLSTTDNGKAQAMYPILSKFNYVICEAKTDGKTYLLDAANSKLGFNHLGANCYNGYARVIDPVLPELIPLFADSLKESKVTTVFIINEKGHKLSASINSTKGYQESVSLREELSKTSQEDFFKTIKKSYTGEVSLNNANVDSVKLLNEPVKVRYDMSIDMGDEDIIYFNPMQAEQQKENPFAAAERFYPVEMPYCWDETYILNMEIPEGYAVDELPKSARVMLNENEGMFEYLLAKNGNNIQMRTRVKLNKALYEPEDYQTLRDFFAYVVKKEAEQIVFKKVK
ncbi:transglutaminase domain-containing protein [Ilyomonas limi]|nr:transglutaminase domain-containing protein [Ilyomonas limi]